MPLKNKRTFTYLLASKAFLVFIIACLALIAYSAYMYVQDSNSSNTSTVLPRKKGNTSSISEQPEQEPERLEPVEGFQSLDNQIKHHAKSNLTKEEMVRAGEASMPAPAPMSINISFSNYNPVQKTFSAGVNFTNDQTMRISACLLEIKANSEQAASQEADVVGQRGASGCRFDSLALNSLPSPSWNEPWKIVIQGNDDTSHSLIVLEKSILSISDLGDLINK